MEEGFIITNRLDSILDVPDTGDHMRFAITTAAASGAALLLAVYLRKKNEELFAD